VRKEAIARAGAAVLRQSGIGGLTHRAVADVARVPLGSTTYYYATLDDLLEAAVTYSIDRSINWLNEWAFVNEGSDFVAAISKMLFDYLTERRAAATFDVEIYVLAARRPLLRKHATRWTAFFVEALTIYVDEPTARHAATMFNGLLLIGISGQQPVSLADITGHFESLTRTTTEHG
jgi:DNA-binding transcriptional regulator YbjK